MMDVAHFEAARHGNFNDFPVSEINNHDLSGIFNKVSPLGNSLLHVAAGSGNLEITELMAHRFPFLMTKKNSKGNTPLHFAVRAEKLNTTQLLVDNAGQITTGDYDTLLRMKNDEGNTALHMALISLKAAKNGRVDNVVAVARYLISADPELSCIVENNARKSPLYLAMESNNRDILDYILSALPQDTGLILHRLQGKNPMRVAIEQKQIDFLRVIKEKKEELLLLKDDEENTLLHYAASNGYLAGVDYLLEINTCEDGHPKTMKKLLEMWPDATEFVCNRGRSILHAASMCGEEEIVSCILKENALGELVNKMDKDGNTPSHLAALSCNPLVVDDLLYQKQSKLDIVNNQGLTAYDLYKLKESQKDQGIDVNAENDSPEMDFKRSEKPNQFRKEITSMLFYKNKEHFSPTTCKLTEMKSDERLSKNDVNNRINILFVVAALIIGPAYAGSLQMPWDGKSKFDALGLEKQLLAEFICGNNIAMFLSITAVFILCTALLIDATFATALIKVAFLFLVLALSFMSGAFSSAINLRTITYEVSSNKVHLMDILLRYYRWLLVGIPLIILYVGAKAFSQYIHLTCFRIHRW
ncbi:hypothetical protein Ddye_013439 [Dipteronia dyeriana]|uniref:PGG domain-containing protein n=1 Tax=Dipteronia dyeriana TaxID=168575 RepID=A0AAD9X687_9ROSI|nr:hypothetical protein Ddye_013439 [Dipteronia dyeriana]